jgi:hypothetical protein
MNAGNHRPAAYDPLPTLLDSPDSYPQKLDLARSCILQIELDEPAYQAASFLDDRILSPGTRGAWLPIARVAAAARLGHDNRPLHFILHTGHVGSTLLSRLIETAGSVLSLREPLPLRTLAEASDALGQPESLLSEPQFELVLDTFVRLWSRGYPTTRCVVLKATSAAARVAPWILRHISASRAVYLSLQAEPYLATLLAGANSPVDLRGHGAERMHRLRSRIATPLGPLHALTPGELAAMSWLAESLTRREILDQWPGRVLAVDFDVLLVDLPHAMRRIADHLQLPVDVDWLERLGSSPVLARYSKSPDHEYSPALRAQVLDQARRDHRDEIRRGLGWLETLARAESAVARVLAADPA